MASPAGIAVAPAVQCAAPAKVNLYLHVVGRRADGYHVLDSLVAFAGCGDCVAVHQADDLSLTVEGRFAGSLTDASDDNLVIRAARALAARLGRPARAAIRLEKNLPVAAGLGGGSADAAATLRALGRLWRATLGDDDLARLALSLGADVPACLAGRPVLVSGIGETLTPVSALPAVHAVLVNPGVALPTPQVFGEFAAAGQCGTAAGPWPPDIADIVGLARTLAARRNDLEPAARRLRPVIGEVLAAIGGQDGCRIARMSGSGASCFGLFASAGAAQRAAVAISARHPGWWCVAAPLLAGPVEPSP